MLHQVNNSVAPNLAVHGTHRSPNAGVIGANRGSISPMAPEPAAILNISASGLELLAALQISYSDGGDNPFFNFDADGLFYNPLDGFWETKAQMKENGAKKLAAGPEETGTLEHLVLTALINPTMDFATANRFTTELSYLINGTYDAFGDPKESLAERIVNREKGLILAEYIAENYIDDPDAKQAFLDGVKQFADSAVERDLNPEPLIKFRRIRHDRSGFTYTREPIIPGFEEAYNAAFRSIAKTLSGDDDDAVRRAMGEIVRRGDVFHEAINILLHDPKLQRDHPKYKEIADRYDAGEISYGVAFVYMHQIADYGMIDGEGDFRLAKKPTSTYYDDAESVKESLANTIEQIRNSLNVDTIKESVMNIVRDILFNTASRPGLLKGMLTQPSTP
jgi:hypothetical protein